MICDVCPRCGTFVLQFTRCACPPELPSGVSKAHSAAGTTPRSAADLLDAAKDSLFGAGWCEAAEWAKRADLRSDMGSAAYARAVETAAGKPEVEALRDRLQLLEQSAALARTALLNSSDIVFQDPAKRHLRAEALAQLDKLIGPTTT
ncbi:hypothetical protein ACOTHJ_12645 [Achromobacter xylosoxidans]